MYTFHLYLAIQKKKLAINTPLLSRMLTQTNINHVLYYATVLQIADLVYDVTMHIKAESGENYRWEKIYVFLIVFIVTKLLIF